MKNRTIWIAITLSMLMVSALVTGCGSSEKQIQQELSYQEPNQEELHEEYQYLAEVNKGDKGATGLINEYGECVVACMFDEITMGMTDDGFRILAYKSVYTDKQGESEAYRYYVLDERGQILEEHGEGIEEEGGGYYNEEALLEEMDNYTPVEAEDAVSEEAEEETADTDSAPTDVEIITTDDGDYELVDQSGKVLISDEDVSGMGVSDIVSMYFTRDGKYVIADTGSMLYDEDELPMGGNVLFDLEGNVKRSNDYESISYGGDNGWLCVHNKKTNQTVYLNSDLKTELDLGDAYGAAGDFKKCLRRK